MASRTNTDAIRELEVTVATLNTRLDHLDRGAGQLDGKVSESRVIVDQIRTELMLLKQRFDDVQATRERRTATQWTLLGIILGAVLAFLLDLLQEVLRQKP